MLREGASPTHEYRCKLLEFFSNLDLDYSIRAELTEPIRKLPEKNKDKAAKEILDLISDCKTPEEMLDRMRNYKFVYNKKSSASEKKYYPMWAHDFPNYSDQHNACYIWECEKDKPNRSLLPVRLYIDGDYFHLEDEEFGEGLETYHDCFLVRKRDTLFVEDILYKLHICIQSAEYVFAKMLYDKSSEILFTEFPNIENISYGEQKENGIYPIKWNIPYDVLINRQLEIMQELLDNGMFLDEKLEETEDSDNPNKFTHIYLDGILDGDPDDVIDAIKNTKREDYLKNFGNKRLTYTLDECMKYYKIFTEDILELGNQKRVYCIIEEQNRDLFEAARRLDAKTLLEYACNGRNLNAICTNGNSVFSEYLNRIIDDAGNPESATEFCEKDVQALVDAGANPALYGVDDIFHPPINNALVRGETEIVKFLLNNNVNPDLFGTIDEKYESETLLEREERWLLEMPYYGSSPNAEELYKEHIRLLEETLGI